MKNIIINILKSIAITVAFNLLFAYLVFVTMLVNQDAPLKNYTFIILFFVLELIPTVLWYWFWGHFLSYSVSKRNIKMAVSVYAILMIVISIILLCFILENDSLSGGYHPGISTFFHINVELICDKFQVSYLIGNAIAFVVEYVFKASCLYIGYNQESKCIKNNE